MPWRLNSLWALSTWNVAPSNSVVTKLQQDKSRGGKWQEREEGMQSKDDGFQKQAELCLRWVMETRSDYTAVALQHALACPI